MRVIDGHCHLGKGRFKNQDVKALLFSMEKAGIERSVICPVEEYITVFNEEGNQYILNTVNENKDRFYGFATVNPWYQEIGVQMLRRYLDKGLSGIKLDPSIQGYILNDELVYPIINVAEEFNVPVYFHTGTPIHSLPLQLRDLAKIYPKVNFIMGHSLANDFGGDVSTALRGLTNVYLDTSHNLTCGTKAAINEFGADHVIFGSNSPRSEQFHELKKVLDSTDDKEILEKVCYKNILSLLGGRT